MVGGGVVISVISVSVSAGDAVAVIKEIQHS